jgi:hypothetical protein|nr:MAG TPA: hypothetical protein [Caudoviricetes sp.]
MRHVINTFIGVFCVIAAIAVLALMKVAFWLLSFFWFFVAVIFIACLIGAFIQEKRDS